MTSAEARLLRVCGRLPQQAGITAAQSAPATALPVESLSDRPGHSPMAASRSDPVWPAGVWSPGPASLRRGGGTHLDRLLIVHVPVPAMACGPRLTQSQ